MNKELTCNQVSALLNFYIDNKLTPKLKELIDKHIENCPICKKKINELQNILQTYRNNSNKASAKETTKPANNEFIHNLSAYVDNELSANENLKIKKIAISNPTARKELEQMYKYKQLLQGAYKKTKEDLKIDYSKNILNELQDNSDYTTTYFYKLAAIFALLITAIIMGFAYLYF